MKKNLKMGKATVFLVFLAVVVGTAGIIVAPPVAQFRAGCAPFFLKNIEYSSIAAKVGAEVPVVKRKKNYQPKNCPGVPLAGYNHGERRVPHWPLPVKTKYTYFMTPSQGGCTSTFHMSSLNLLSSKFWIRSGARPW